MKYAFFALSLGAAVTVGGCRDESPEPTTAPTVNKGAVIEEDVHEGMPHDLGTVQVGAYSVSVTQIGDITPGSESVFELVVTGEAAKPKAVRAWIGTESAEGSTKGKAEAESGEGEFHAHVDVPATLAEGSKLWIEVETDTGREKSAIDVKR